MKIIISTCRYCYHLHSVAVVCVAMDRVAYYFFHVFFAYNTFFCKFAYHTIQLLEMMKNKVMKVLFLVLLALLLAVSADAGKPKKKTQTDREYWCTLAYNMAQPVLENMAKGELQKNMMTEYSPSFDNRNRKVVFMETFGRLMAGIAPWLSLPDQGLEV